MHASRVCSQHLFGLRMNGIQRTQFGSSVTRNMITFVWTIHHVKLAQSTTLELKRFHLASLLPALRNLWLFLVFNNVLISLTLYFCLSIKDKSAELRKKGRKERKSLWYKIVSTEAVRFVLKRFFRKIRMSF